jgi:hypothetical protein
LTIWNVTIDNTLNFVKADSVEDAIANFPNATDVTATEATEGEAKAFLDAEEQTFAYVILQQLKKMTGELREYVSKK